MAHRSTEEMDAIRAGMMEELGNARLDSFPLDDGRRGRDRERARAQPPLGPAGRAAQAAPKANNDLGKAWLEAIRDGQFDDLEAHAVKNLDDLGGGRIWAANATNIAARTNTILRGVDMMPKPSPAFGSTPRHHYRNQADAGRVSSLGAVIPVGGSTVVFNAGKAKGPAAARDTGPARTAVNSQPQQYHHHHQRHQHRQQQPQHRQPQPQQRRAAANTGPGPARPSATAAAPRLSLAAGQTHVSPTPATQPGTKTCQAPQAVKGGQGTKIPPDTRPHLRPKGPPATPPAHAPPAEQAAATAPRTESPTAAPTGDAAPTAPETVVECLVLEMHYLSLGHKSAIPGRVSLKLSTSSSRPEPTGGTLTFEVVCGPIKKYDIEQCRGARRDSRSVGLILLNEDLSVTHEVLYFTSSDVATEFYLSLSGVCHVFRRARLATRAVEAVEGTSAGAAAAPANTTDGPAESQAADGPATAARTGVLLPLEDEPPIVKSASRELAEMSADFEAYEAEVACQQSNSASKPQAPCQAPHQPQNKPHQQPQQQWQQQPLRQKTEAPASRMIPATFAAGMVGMLVGSGQKRDSPTADKSDKPAVARARPSAAKTPQPAQPKRPELQAATDTRAAAPVAPVESATVSRSMAEPVAQEKQPQEQPQEQPVAATAPLPVKPEVDVVAGADSDLGGPHSGAAPSAAASKEDEEPEPPLSPPAEPVFGDGGGVAATPIDEVYHAFLSALFTEGQSIEDHDALEQILGHLVQLTIHVSGLLTGLGIGGDADAQDLIRKSVVEKFMKTTRVRHVTPDRAEEFKTILSDMVAAYSNGVPMSELMGRIRRDDQDDLLMGEDDIGQESNQPSGDTRRQKSSRESSQRASEKSTDQAGFGDHLMDREEPTQSPESSQKPADRDGSDASTEDAPAAVALTTDTPATAYDGVAANDAADSSVRHQYSPEEIIGLRANATPRPDQLDRADPTLPRTTPQHAPKLAGPFIIPAHADQARPIAHEKPEANRNGHKDADTAAKYESWLFTDNVKSSSVSGWNDKWDMAEYDEAYETTDREAGPGPTKPAPVGSPSRAPVGARTDNRLAAPARAPVAVAAPGPVVADPAPAPAAAAAVATPIPAPALAPAPTSVPAPDPKADHADTLSPDAKAETQVEITIRAALSPGGNVHRAVVLVDGEESSADPSLIKGLVFSALYNTAVQSSVSDTATTAPAANNSKGGGGLKNSMWAH